MKNNKPPSKENDPPRSRHKSIALADKDIVVREAEIKSLKKFVSPLEQNIKGQLKNIKELPQDKAEILRKRHQSILDLNARIMQLTKDVETIRQERDDLEQLLHAKQKLYDELNGKQDRLGELVDSIEQTLQENARLFDEQMSEFEKERQRILNDPSLTESERAEKLKQLDQKIKDYKDKYEEQKKILEGQLAEAKKNCDDNHNHRTNVHTELQQQLNAELSALEKMKIGATPEELAEIEAKMANLKRKFQSQLRTDTYEQKLAELEKRKIGASPEELAKIEAEIAKLKMKHGRTLSAELAELERRKIGASPSELAEIEAKIANLKKKQQKLFGSDIAAELAELEKRKIGASPAELAEIEAKMAILRKKERKQYMSDISDELAALERKKIGASPAELAEIEAKIASLRKKQLKHMIADIDAELAELERMKIGASPAELARIMARIAYLQMKRQKLLKTVELQSKIDAEIAELERQKIGASPAQLAEIEAKIAKLKMQSNNLHDDIFKDIKKTESQSEKAYREAMARLEASKLGKSPSEIMRIDNEIRKMMEEFKHKFSGLWSDEYELHTCRSDMSIGQDFILDSAAKMQQGMAEYVQKSVGVPLRRGIAYLCVHRPQNPISCLSNFLLQYRYNELYRENHREDLEEIIVHSTRQNKQEVKSKI